jgi:hypothetical protein
MATFTTGSVVVTPGVRSSFEAGFLQTCYQRHKTGDWGDLDPTDRAMNSRAQHRKGSRLMSAYKKDQETLWVITEGPEGSDRVTTFLLPSEY